MRLWRRFPRAGNDRLRAISDRDRGHLFEISAEVSAISRVD
ncbi:hypothetical protein T261_3760 [Streptomyces lydicus]|nr:hypothetical protein T261_3760 [Streptomyces lydicus]